MEILRERVEMSTKMTFGCTQYVHGSPTNIYKSHTFVLSILKRHLKEVFQQISCSVVRYQKWMKRIFTYYKI